MMLRALAKYLLRNRLQIPLENWTTQGFGFLRLRISENVRMHVWDSRLRQAGVSDIHDHTQWAFTSHILSGQLINIRYEITEAYGTRYNMGVIKTGIGGGMQSVEPKVVFLHASTPELYLPGDKYHQEPDEIHRTLPSDGAVTIIEQERRENESARVFWPIGGIWGDAIPRQCTAHEVEEVAGYALSIFGP